MHKLTRTSSNSLQLYIFMILFFPTLWGYLGKNGISFGQIFYSLSILIIGVLILIFHRNRLIFPSLFFNIFIILTLSYIISLTLNAAIFDGHVTISDFSDIIRPIIYLLSMSIGYSLFDNSINLPKLTKYIAYIIICCALFDLIKLFPAGTELLKLYTHLSPGSFNYMRFSGTFAYCYNYVYVLILGFLISLFCSNRKLLIFYIILIVLAGSRSGFVATAVALFFYYIIEKGYISACWYMLLLIIIIGIIIYALTKADIPLIDDIFSNVEKLLNAIMGIDEDGSMNSRNSQLNRAIANFCKSPIWGCGPMKSSDGPIEIQMAYYISSWGIIGTCFYLMIIGGFIFIATKTIKLNGLLGAFSKANLVWIICSFIIGLSTPITDQIRVSQLFFLLQGIQYKIYLNHKTRRAETAN